MKSIEIKLHIWKTPEIFYGLEVISEFSDHRHIKRYKIKGAGHIGVAHQMNFIPNKARYPARNNVGVSQV